jgi:hypothetical protein
VTGGTDPEYGKVRITSDGTAKSAESVTLGDDAVTTAKILNANVTAAKLATDAVETAKIKDANVTAAKLATDAVETAKIKDANVSRAKVKADALALGDFASYAKTTSGAQTLLAANGADNGDRVVIIHAKVTTTFADGDGGQPVFTIGETDTADKFADGTDFNDATAGDVFVYYGVLTENKALLVTGTAATGTGDGVLAVSVIAVPKE